MILKTDLTLWHLMTGAGAGEPDFTFYGFEKSLFFPDLEGASSLSTVKIAILLVQPLVNGYIAIENGHWWLMSLKKRWWCSWIFHRELQPFTRGYINSSFSEPLYSESEADHTTLCLRFMSESAVMWAWWKAKIRWFIPRIVIGLVHPTFFTGISRVNPLPTGVN